LDIDETFKGAHGTIGEGGCCYNKKTENLLNSIRDIFAQIIKPMDEIYDYLFDDPYSEVMDFVEDCAGSTFISAGFMLFLASGGTSAPLSAALIISGEALCFNAACANSLDDLQNPKIFMEGCSSVLLAAAGGPELKIVGNAAKLAIKTTIKDCAETIIKSSFEQNGFNSARNIIKTYRKDKLLEWRINISCDLEGYIEN